MDVDIPESVGIGERLNELLAEAGHKLLASDVAVQFGAYCVLLRRWNARTNLTAIRDEEGILRRHFVESIVCARLLPEGIATLLDFGTGAGFPGLPISLCRPEIAVTLAESQGKKAAFLCEAVRTLGVKAQVHAGRAEAQGELFDCVTLRGVDRMQKAVRGASGLVGGRGGLAVVTTSAAAEEIKGAASSGFTWSEPALLERGTERILLLGRRDG